MSHTPSVRRRVLWPLLAAAVALVPVLGAFSTTRVFYVRDLAMYFWPRHLWMRETVRRGDWPWWDPYAGAGQSAVSDALNHFFVLPVTLVRLVLPDVPGFNFWVAAPFPVAAVGAWLWLRRYGSSAAAFVGAAVFALSGAVVSSGGFPNMSWAVACIPWALWATDRLLEQPGAGRVANLAFWVAMAAVAGEAITLVGTAALVVVYAAIGPSAAGWRERVARLTRTGLALTAAALLSAVQVIPLGWAAMRSPRGVAVDLNSWSMHPLELLELVVAHLFGHPYAGMAQTMPWMNAFHNREPLLFTLYVGLGALALAAVSPRDADARRRRAFWWTVAAIAVLCALGRHAPFYPALQDAVPVLQSFRFPVKYLVFAMTALAALTASGADALLAHARTRTAMRRPVLPLALMGAAAVLAAAFGIGAIVARGAIGSVWEWIAMTARTAIPTQAAEWMLDTSPPLLGGAAAMAAGMAILITIVWTGHRAAPVAAAACCALAVIDPAVVNRDAHPTMAASVLGAPAWVSVMGRTPEDRVYVGGRVIAPIQPPRVKPIAVDAPLLFTADAAWSFAEGNAVLGAEFAYFPAAWQVRESIGYDLPQLWPTEYARVVQRFGRASREDRLRFVRRTGVRYCYLPEPPEPAMPPLAVSRANNGAMALYECGPGARRVYVTPAARLEPELRTQLELMFDPSHDPSQVLLIDREPPPPTGLAGPPARPDARIVEERNSLLVVHASAGPEGGYLNVLDTYDPNWMVEVDGQVATLLRANTVFRAVRIPPGEHEVRFTYRPAPFYAGLATTVATVVVLLLAVVAERLTAPNAARRMRQAVTAS